MLSLATAVAIATSVRTLLMGGASLVHEEGARERERAKKKEKEKEEEEEEEEEKER